MFIHSLPRCGPRRSTIVIGFVFAVAMTMADSGLADGIVVPPRDYQGSLEERAQEAIIIFQSYDQPGKAKEDMILKINVEGDAKNFAWVIPFPDEPTIAKEDAALFAEMFNYVESRLYRSRKSGSKSDSTGSTPKAAEESEPVQVISRQVVGEFDIAVVRENEQGGLNPWLEDNGYQKLKDAEQTLTFYREKKYVFACIRVSSEVLASQQSVDSHPLRFTFATGGRDGIYFPMKLTGLQSKPFDVNLYVFHRYWINDKLSRFGYRHRGFQLRYRDWDSPKCVANGGKSYSLPEEDPFLGSVANLLPTTTKLFQKLHPGNNYYLTNIQANGLKPEDVRQWSDDLWLFPYYTDRSRVPFDARPGGPAQAAYPDVTLQVEPDQRPRGGMAGISWPRTIGLAAFLMALAAVGIALARRASG